MTSDEVAAVRSTWPIIAANTELLTERFYAHLFDIDESAARLFAGVDMTLQRTRLAQALAVVVHNIDNPESLMPTVAALGRRHAGYGVVDRHFESVGDALLWALTDVLGEHLDPAHRDAWANAYALIASVMRRALVARPTTGEMRAVRSPAAHG
jgi:hemoglobin-like flavoprotein